MTGESGRQLRTVTVRTSFPQMSHGTLWKQIGRFDDLAWSGDDPWAFEGKLRTLSQHGLKEELVSSHEYTYTYRMLKGPFKNFEVTLSAEAGEGGSVAVYSATGELDEEQQGMVREGAIEAFEGLAQKLAQAAAA